jgi:hypothetical protein
VAETCSRIWSAEKKSKDVGEHEEDDDDDEDEDSGKRGR